MASKSKETRGYIPLWKRMIASPHFWPSFGLVGLVLIFLVSANTMARSDSFYQLGADGHDTYVWFTMNNKGPFTAESKDLPVLKPVWLPDKDFDELLKVRESVKGSTIWDDELFDRFQAALNNNPAKGWVESVPVLRRRFPSYLVVSMNIRVPYARVAWKGKDFFVDKSGQLLNILPGSDTKLSLIRIEGVTEAPSEWGKKWDSVYLADALGLMGFLQSRLTKGDQMAELLCAVERIVCSPSHEKMPEVKKPKLVLYTTTGCEITWDMYFEDDRSFGRPGRDYKLNNMRKLFMEGRIDDLANIKSIDLSVEDPVVIYRGRK